METVKALELHLVKLDVESRHQIEESIRQDATNLYESYVKVNEDHRLDYEEKVLQGLNDIQQQAEELKNKVATSDATELEKALLVIKNKYAGS